MKKVLNRELPVGSAAAAAADSRIYAAKLVDNNPMRQHYHHHQYQHQIDNFGSAIEEQKAMDRDRP